MGAVGGKALNALSTVDDQPLLLEDPRLGVFSQGQFEVAGSPRTCSRLPWPMPGPPGPQPQIAFAPTVGSHKLESARIGIQALGTHSYGGQTDNAEAAGGGVELRGMIAAGGVKTKS
jgi:hypothetical protein